MSNIDELIERLRYRANLHTRADYTPDDGLLEAELMREAADTLAELQAENEKLKSDNNYLSGQLMTIRYTDEPERCAILFRIDTWAALRRGTVHDLADIVMHELHRAIDEQFR